MTSNALRFFPCVLLLGCLLAASAPVGAQCTTYNGKVLEDLYELEPSQHMKDLFHQLLEHAGPRAETFQLSAAASEAIGIAAAVICDDVRKVLYSPNRLAEYAGERGDWVLKSILAHEIGHHMNADTLHTTRSLHRRELDADDYAAYLLCQLGATIENVRNSLDLYAANANDQYPERAIRVEAAAAGWSRAIGQGKCPPEARNAVPTQSLTGLKNRIDITPENAAEFANRSQLAAEVIHIADVDFEAGGPMTLFADRLTFEGSALLRGDRLNVVAHTIEGGSITADGVQAGEDGGNIMVAAVQIKGTSITARGGAGSAGRHGKPGTDGAAGSNGRSGKCGPGALGQFRGSKAGGNGGNGTAGEDGEDGGPGGDGGQIILLTFQQRALYLNVDGGPGGQGGDGGQGGRGGPGGRGGAGCSGLGGSQPTRSPGADGRPGRDGASGADGLRGDEGRIWNLPLAGLDSLKNKLENKYGDLAQTVLELRQMAVRDAADSEDSP